MSVSQELKKSLKSIYQYGKIEFIPELRITRDTFPEHVYVRFISGIAISDNNIYISDSHFGSIRILNNSGEFKKSFGQIGKGPGDLFLPRHMIVASNKLFVWEVGNKRFSIFTTDGKFINHTSLKNKGIIKDMKMLENGRIILERELSGKIKKEFVQFFVLELYSKELDFIKLLYKKRILRIKYLSKPYRNALIQPFQPDVSWDIMPGNKIVIGFSGNYQVEIHDITTGKVQAFTRSYNPVKVTEADKKAFFEGMIIGGTNRKLEKGANKFIRDNTVFPDYKPAFKKIITDSEGNILVFLYKNSQNNKYKFFDAFDSKGNYINNVKIIPEEGIYIDKIFPGKENVFWTVVEVDDFDLGVVKYSVR
jgi:hypothetical protein